MSLSVIDKIIAREVGYFLWHFLPDIYPGLVRDEKDEGFRALWARDESDELNAVRREDPFVDYPVIYLEAEVQAGLAPAPFLYPPSHGQALRLSQYLRVLRRFLSLQFTTKKYEHLQLIWRAVGMLARELPQRELLCFVDQLWRGRWVVDKFEWARMRLAVITGGSEEAMLKLENDVQWLDAEAIRIIQTERQLKDSARSMDEWLHEAYCLLPEIAMSWILIREASKRLHSDELGKYDRVLDEFLADIGTTMDILCLALRGGENLAEVYAIRPLLQHQSVDKAISVIRGTYRGRSIIPRVWYEAARTALERLPTHDALESDGHAPEGMGRRITLLASDHLALNHVDLAGVFGRALTMDSKDGHWMLLGTLFDHWDVDDNQ